MANLGAHLLYGFIAPRRLFFAADARSMRVRYVPCMVMGTRRLTGAGQNQSPICMAQIAKRRRRRPILPRQIYGRLFEPVPATARRREIYFPERPPQKVFSEKVKNINNAVWRGGCGALFSLSLFFLALGGMKKSRRAPSNPCFSPILRATCVQRSLGLHLSSKEIRGRYKVLLEKYKARSPVSFVTACVYFAPRSCKISDWAGKLLLSMNFIQPCSLTATVIAGWHLLTHLKINLNCITRI